MSLPNWTGAKPFAENAWLIEYKMGAVILGDVMWFGPANRMAVDLFYPHLHNRRFGAFGTLEGAKRRVEERALLPAEVRS